MTPHTGRIRVLLIEHNRILLEGLSHLLSELPGIELAGVSTSGIAAIAMFKQKRPHITVIDLELPDTTATDLVRMIRQVDPDALILILATYELDPAGAQAITSGAAALVAKDQANVLLEPLIRSLAGRFDTGNDG